MKTIKVLVVDDHTIVRDGICALLGLAGDMEVVGEASNGREAIEMVRKLAPDIVLMDIAMPIMGGLEATHRIHKESPNVKVLALTQYDDREYVFPIIEAGAYGFISKSAASSELTTGIRSVYRGDSFLSPSVAKFLVEVYRQGNTLKKGPGHYDELTAREREVMKLLAEGYTIQEIANMLSISPKTAETHRASIMKKLKARNVTDIVKYCIRNRIIEI